MFGGGISGTQMRQMICRGDDRIVEFFPDHIASREMIDPSKPRTGTKLQIKNLTAAKEVWGLMVSGFSCPAEQNSQLTPLATIAEGLYDLVEQCLNERSKHSKSFQKTVAVRRLKNAHRAHFKPKQNRKQKKTSKIGKPFNVSPSLYKSNAFARNEEVEDYGHKIQIEPPGVYGRGGEIDHEERLKKTPIDEENLEELSAVAGGGVGGHVNGAWGAPNDTNVYEETDDEDYLEEEDTEHETRRT